MNSLERLLTVVLILLGVVVLVLLVIFWQMPEAGSALLPANTVSLAGSSADPLAASGDQPTALLAYGLAQRQAQSWAGDAQLVKASATWSQVRQGSQVSSGTAAWNLTFYSPAERSLLVVSTNGRETTQISNRATTELFELENVGGWQIDSDEAVSAMLAAGGEEWLQVTREPAALIATLATTGTEGRLEWFLSLVDRNSQSSFTVYLDATTGEVLGVERSP